MNGGLLEICSVHTYVQKGFILELWCQLYVEMYVIFFQRNNEAISIR